MEPKLAYSVNSTEFVNLLTTSPYPAAMEALITTAKLSAKTNLTSPCAFQWKVKEDSPWAKHGSVIEFIYDETSKTRKIKFKEIFDPFVIDNGDPNCKPTDFGSLKHYNGNSEGQGPFHNQVFNSTLDISVVDEDGDHYF